MITIIILPIIGLTAFYFIVKFYYLKNVYVIKTTKTVPRSSSYEINASLINIIRSRRESQTSLNKFCSSDDDLEAIDLKSDSSNIIDIDNTFTYDHIPDLNSWLENSRKEVPLNCCLNNNLDNNNLDNQLLNRNSIKDLSIDIDDDKYVKKNEITGSIKFLNLNSEQLNGKQLQILTSLSYLVNEERLSVVLCKLKLPIFKNFHQQFNKYSNIANQNYLKIYQQSELIKQTKYIFVKAYLIDSTTRKRLSKKKSSLLSVDGANTILNNNPYDCNKYIVINELMVFKLPINQLSKITIKLTVLGLSSLNNLYFNDNNLKAKKNKKLIDTLYSLGYVEIGCNSLSKSAFLHYQNLLNNLKRPTCCWHVLDLKKNSNKRKSYKL